MRHILLLLCVFLGRSAAEEIAWTKPETDAIAAIQGKVAVADGRARVETEDYTIEAEAEAVFTAKLAVYMQKMRKELLGLLAIDQQRRYKGKAKVVVFKDKATYQDTLGVAGSRGRFRHKQKNGEMTEFTLYTYIKEDKERDFEQFYHPILRHEGTHQILQEFSGPDSYPDLLNEGMASFVQSWTLGKDLAYNLANRRSAYRKGMGGDLVPATVLRLAEILDPTPWDVDNFGPKTDARYFHADMLIEYMLIAKPRSALLHTWLRDIMRGKRNDAAIQKELAAMQPGFAEFILATQGRR